MEKKRVVLLAIAVSLSFIGGAYASTPLSTTIQRVFVTNFPSNQNVTVTNPSTVNSTVQTLSVVLTLTTRPNCLNGDAFCTFYTVAGWRTISTTGVPGFATDWGFLIKGVFQGLPCLITVNTTSGNAYCARLPLGGQGEVVTVPVQGDEVYFGFSQSGNVAIFLQR